MRLSRHTINKKTRINTSRNLTASWYDVTACISDHVASVRVGCAALWSSLFVYRRIVFWVLFKKWLSLWASGISLTFIVKYGGRWVSEDRWLLYTIFKVVLRCDCITLSAKGITSLTTCIDTHYVNMSQNITFFLVGKLNN